MEPPALMMFEQLGLSLLLGLLVGLQREHAAAGMAGMRTFPLISLLGTVSALLGTVSAPSAVPFGGWVTAAGLLAVAGVLIFATLLKHWDEGGGDLGTTTVVAGILMYAVGALLVVAPLAVGVAVGGGAAILLQYKPELHGFVRRLGERDVRAIMQFALITCIVLPVLPNRTYGPFDVLNPYRTWLMVVLIVGMSLGGYIAYKFLGRDAGILLGGVLGGAISSTATTVSYARSARADPISARAAAVVIMIASAVLFARVLIVVGVVAPDFLATAAPPLAIMMGLTTAASLAVWYRIRRHSGQVPEQENPTQLKSAVVFAAMYVLVLFALAGAKQYLQGQWLYLVAALSGLPDMDAITLSAAQMVRDQALAAGVAWRLIVVAVLANFGSKACIAAVLGGSRLLRPILLLFAVPVIAGIVLLAVWPAG